MPRRRAIRLLGEREFELQGWSHHEKDRVLTVLAHDWSMHELSSGCELAKARASLRVRRQRRRGAHRLAATLVRITASRGGATRAVCRDIIEAVRALAEVRIFRQDEREAEADADALYWDRIPVDERAEFVWRLSLELHELSNPTQRHEPRLSRSVARVLGR